MKKKMRFAAHTGYTALIAVESGAGRTKVYRRKTLLKASDVKALKKYLKGIRRHMQKNVYKYVVVSVVIVFYRKI